MQIGLSSNQIAEIPWYHGDRADSFSCEKVRLLSVLRSAMDRPRGLNRLANKFSLTAKCARHGRHHSVQNDNDKRFWIFEYRSKRFGELICVSGSEGTGVAARRVRGTGSFSACHKDCSYTNAISARPASAATPKSVDLSDSACAFGLLSARVLSRYLGHCRGMFRLSASSLQRFESASSFNRGATRDQSRLSSSLVSALMRG